MMWAARHPQVSRELRYREFGNYSVAPEQMTPPHSPWRQGRALRSAMRYQTKLLVTAGLLLAMSLSAAALAFWGVTQSHSYLTRSRVAHEQIERPLQLSRHSQQLFQDW